MLETEHVVTEGPMLLDRKLTHGCVNKVTHSGRVADSWEGAVHVIAKGFRDSCRNIIDRGGAPHMHCLRLVEIE